MIFSNPFVGTVEGATNRAPYMLSLANPSRTTLKRLNVLNVIPDSSVGDHLAKSGAELADGAVMDEVGDFVQRTRLRD